MKQENNAKAEWVYSPSFQTSKGDFDEQAFLGTLRAAFVDVQGLKRVPSTREFHLMKKLQSIPECCSSMGPL